jgi:hypothetical protein
LHAGARPQSLRPWRSGTVVQSELLTFPEGPLPPTPAWRRRRRLGFRWLGRSNLGRLFDLRAFPGLRRLRERQWRHFRVRLARRFFLSHGRSLDIRRQGPHGFRRRIGEKCRKVGLKICGGTIARRAAGSVAGGNVFGSATLALRSLRLLRQVSRIRPTAAPAAPALPAG